MLKDAEHGVRSTTFFKWRCACWSTDVIVLDRSAGQSSKTDVGESRRGAARRVHYYVTIPLTRSWQDRSVKLVAGPHSRKTANAMNSRKLLILRPNCCGCGGVQPAVLAAVAKRCNSRRAAQRSDTADPVVAPMRLAGGKPPGARR
jgi:hypothetical protein